LSEVLSEELPVALSELASGKGSTKNLFWKIRSIKTPKEIEASATLNTGLKNSKLSPPHIGNQDGKCPSVIMGK
jgi:hypothetical protein